MQVLIFTEPSSIARYQVTDHTTGCWYWQLLPEISITRWI